MRSFLFLLLSVCVLLPVAAIGCLAQDFQGIPADEMALTEVPGYPQAPAIVLYHEVTDDDNHQFREVYMRIKVLTQAGRERANVELVYNRKVYKLDNIKARTVHADASIVNFTGEPFDRTVVKGRGIRYEAKAFTLPDVQVGSIIEYRYRAKYKGGLRPPLWLLQEDLFQRRVRYTFKPWWGRVQDQHGVTSNGVKYTWLTPSGTNVVQRDKAFVYEASDIPPFTEEPFMPPPSLLKYSIHFYYNSGRSVQVFWDEEGNYWSRDIDLFLNDKPALKQELARIISSGDTDEQKVRKIYAHVAGYQNLSYLPENTQQELTAIGIGGKYNVGDVIRAKTGDRDDLTRLFIGLVREAGITAYAMRVTARDDSYFIPQNLNWSQLDSEVAIVVLNGKEVFLDPGTRFCPYGLIHWSRAGAKGVRQTSTPFTQIAETPFPSYQDATIARLAKLQLNEDGAVEGDLEVAFIGQEALIHRIDGAKTDDVGRTKLLEDEVKSWLPAEAEIKLTNKPLWEDASQPLTAVLKVKCPVANSVGRRMLVPMNIFHLNRPAALRQATRKYPVRFEFPYGTAEEIHLKLPPKMTVESVPAKQEINIGYAFFGSQYQQRDGELATLRRVVLGGSVVPVEKYAQIKDFFEKIKAADDQQVVLTKAAAGQAK